MTDCAPAATNGTYRVSPNVAGANDWTCPLPPAKRAFASRLGTSVNQGTACRRWPGRLRGSSARPNANGDTDSADAQELLGPLRQGVRIEQSSSGAAEWQAVMAQRGAGIRGAVHTAVGTVHVREGSGATEIGHGSTRQDSEIMTCQLCG